MGLQTMILETVRVARNKSNGLGVWADLTPDGHSALGTHLAQLGEVAYDKKGHLTIVASRFTEENISGALRIAKALATEWVTTLSADQQKRFAGIKIRSEYDAEQKAVQRAKKDAEKAEKALARQ